MTKQELISTIETERAKLEESLSGLTPEQMSEPNVCGNWCVKDVLAHLAIWSARNVTVIYHAEQAQTYEEIDAMLDDYDALNAEDYETQKDRPLERVLADFRGAHRQLLRRLGDWKDAELFDQKRYAWLRRQSLGEFLADAAGHEAEHRKQIEQWRK